MTSNLSANEVNPKGSSLIGDIEQVSREDKIGFISVACKRFMYSDLIARINGKAFGQKGVGEGLMQISEKIKDGRTEDLEELLLLQVELLNQTFMNYTELISLTDSTAGKKVFAEIALKSQNQCRRTITTLADLKTPKRTTFIKNSAVNQQVNLGDAPSNSSEELENLEKIRADELIGDINERMDAGATSKAVRSDQAVEALGEVHRAQECHRKSQGSPE